MTFPVGRESSPYGTGPRPRAAACGPEITRSPRFGVRQQAVRFAFDDFVALAAALLDAGAIEHRDMSAGVSDQAQVVQLACRFRDAFATYPEHAAAITAVVSFGSAWIARALNSCTRCIGKLPNSRFSS